MPTAGSDQRFRVRPLRVHQTRDRERRPVSRLQPDRIRQVRLQPSLHFPERARATPRRTTFSSDVVFVGTADADRLPYLDALLSIPRLRLALYGSDWDRQPDRYRRYVRGLAIGREYRLALGGAKIALGLLRSANRDQHTMRTFEIPACGAFLCAERTDEHEELFRERAEAIFFSDPDELKSQITRYSTTKTPACGLPRPAFVP